MLGRILKPKFFVCEYEVENHSGQFACLETVHDKAVTEAKAYITKIAKSNGEYDIIVRPATIIERLR